MPETPLWDELTRSEQRSLIRLFGGGSLRNQNPKDVEGLCRRGLVDDEQNLSVPGLLALTLAMRRQQTDALAGLRARPATARYLSRSRTRCTWTADHSPLPRGVGIP